MTEQIFLGGDILPSGVQPGYPHPISRNGPEKIERASDIGMTTDAILDDFTEHIVRGGCVVKEQGRIYRNIQNRVNQKNSDQRNIEADDFVKQCSYFHKMSCLMFCFGHASILIRDIYVKGVPWEKKLFLKKKKKKKLRRSFFAGQCTEIDRS